uniref:Uncharacterized protein n=1 Tax=Romanomermis culicivorax TaxID=13658 RepID=A0A915KE21_ROMCU
MCPATLTNGAARLETLQHFTFPPSLPKLSHNQHRNLGIDQASDPQLLLEYPVIIDDALDLQMVIATAMQLGTAPDLHYPLTLLTCPCSLEEYEDVEETICNTISTKDDELRKFFMLQCWLDSFCTVSDHP